MSQLDQALEVLDLSTMLGSFALSIAEAQLALDSASIRTAEMMSGRYEVTETDAKGNLTTRQIENRFTFLGEQASLLELGFTPTFYHFTETTMEVKVSYSMSSTSAQEQSSSQRSEVSASRTKRRGFLGTGGSTTTTTTNVSTVDARFASRFAYSLEASSRISTKLVAAPAPSNLMNIITAVIKEKAT